MDAFLDELAAATPTPGGGAAGAMAAAMAAALGEMAIGIAVRKGQAEAEDVQGFRILRLRFAALAEEDASAYQEVLKALRRPKEDPGRAEALARALDGAADVPLRGLALLVELRQLLRAYEAHCPPAARSDYHAADALVGAAVRILAESVAVNLDGAASRGRIESDLARLRAALDEAGGTFAGDRGTTHGRKGGSPVEESGPGGRG